MRSTSRFALTLLTLPLFLSGCASNSTNYQWSSAYSPNNQTSTSTPPSSSKSSTPASSEAKIPATSMTMTKYTSKLEVGATFQFEVSFEPSNATDRYPVWASSNPSVISISQNGLAQGLAAGSSEITATTSEWIARVTVVVTEKMPIVNVTLPATCSYYVSRTSAAYSRVQITKVEFGTMYDLGLRDYVFAAQLTIKKTYDRDGSTGTNLCGFQYAVYSSSGSVVIHNSFLYRNKWVGDEWTNAISLDGCQSGQTYRLEFSDYI